MADFVLHADDKLWRQFKERAATEGHTMRWIILTLIADYVRHGLPKVRL
jgi:hypothetical protein